MRTVRTSAARLLAVTSATAAVLTAAVAVAATAGPLFGRQPSTTGAVTSRPSVSSPSVSSPSVSSPSVSSPSVSSRPAPGPRTSSRPSSPQRSSTTTLTVGTAGSVTVAAAGGVLDLVSVDPAPGWTVDEVERGRRAVEVRLVRGGVEAKLEAWLSGGRLLHESRTRAGR